MTAIYPRISLGKIALSRLEACLRPLATWLS